MRELERIDRIRKLADTVRVHHNSPRNRQKLALWVSPAGLPNAFTRWIPKRGLPRPPFIADLDRELWVKVLGMDIEEVYRDPLAYLEFELRKKIHAFENLEDDLPILKSVTIWHGVGILQTLFGLDQEPAKNGHEPWVGKRRILESREDLPKLKIPDFFRSGLMPKIHAMYRTIREALDEDFAVVFPEWDFGSFGMALSLRGAEDLLIDMLEDPPFVRDLMGRLYESKVHYSEERARYLGEPIRPLYLANDDVSIPMITADAYEQYLLPYEVRMSELHGGMDYWHSCGRIDGILHLIKKIPGLKMIHISYANDFRFSAETIGKDQIIEYVLNPIGDVLTASPEQMEARLRFIKEINRGLDYTVRADAFQLYTNLNNDLHKVRSWLEKCRTVWDG